MSVIFFEAEELGNIAALTRVGSERETVFRLLAEVSRANARAYNKRYRTRDAQAFTAACVKAAVPAPTRVSLARAAGTARLLYYNCAEPGAEPTTSEQRALTCVVSMVLGFVNDNFF